MEELNNQQPAEETAEQAAPVEMKKGILLTPGKLVALIAGVAVLVAVLVGAVVYGMGGFAKDDVADAETSEVTEETVIPTYAADTGRNDVTYKGTYTVSDEEVLSLADQVVATIGENVLTVGELQVYYWLEVQNFLFNNYYYLSYYGMDYTLPLDMQTYDGYTWQQYFLDAALQSWHSYQSMANVAKENDYVIPDDARTYLITLEHDLKERAEAQGFATADELLAYNVGAGANVEDYVSYEGLYVLASEYCEHAGSKINPTFAEVEEFFAEHEAEYAEGGINKEGDFIDVRHILAMPKGGVTNENGETIYSEEEWEACRQAAQAILDEWLSGDKTEESFAELANTYTEDGNDSDRDGVPDGGLYTNVYEDMMVPAFNDWCFDTSRQYGDYDLVRTEYGYHVMFFVKRVPIWQTYAESDLVATLEEKIVTDAIAAYPMEVDYNAIALGEVDIATWFAG